MKKTAIYLTRHGETLWNIEKRMQGHQDSPLTALGIRQATWLRDALSSIDFAAIYTSPSPRAKKTAEILCDQREIEIIGNEALREIFMGDWEGQITREIQQSQATAYTAFWETPHLYVPENGGESYLDVQKRVIPLLHLLLEQHAGESILIVTHTVTLKLIMSHFEARQLARLWEPPFIHPTSLCKVLIENQQASIELHGDISHYQEKMNGYKA